ncbi:MAG TPA: hypothetical protein VH815_02375 [Acidobacteriota bacterium]|jgi:hypothetical protein
MSDFDRARITAFIDDILSIVQGKPADLLPFHEVRERLHLKQLVDRGIQEIPLAPIVGTVGRERDFNRAFFPREESLRQRWKEVKELAEGPIGFPPVELYKVHDVFFVVDGHHRVSVARSLNAPTIEAHVMEFLSPIPLTPDTSIEELILKSALTDFLETTGLVQEYPGEYEVSIPKGYQRLLDHISVHRYYRGIETKHDISWQDALNSWRDTVYHPMVKAIRKSGILEQFPDKTETDLYLFVMDHLHNLRQRYGKASDQRDRLLKHFALSEQNKKSRKKKSKIKKDDSET